MNGTLTGSYTNQSCSAAAVPTASISASPNPVAYNGRSTLTWSSSNATSCTAGGAWSNSGTLAGSGLTDPLTAQSSFTFQCTGTGGTSALQSVTVGVNAAGSCSLPWGGSIASGSSVTAYQFPSGTSLVCSSAVETRYCSNGTLSGTFTNQSCTVLLANCTTPWGSSIASGSSVTAYLSSSVTAPVTCFSVSQIRTCNNGTLSGSFTKQSCSAPTAPCTTPWGSSIASGSSVTAYKFPFSDQNSCSFYAQTRPCSNGTLYGSYTNQSCSAPIAPCVTPWGAYIPSGSSVTAYQFIAVKSPKACSSISETRACTNGTLSGSFVNQYCKVMPTYSSF